MPKAEKLAWFLNLGTLLACVCKALSWPLLTLDFGQETSDGR